MVDRASTESKIKSKGFTARKNSSKLFARNRPEAGLRSNKRIDAEQQWIMNQELQH